ncbi:MAG: tRNA (N(6)-L-threonylcarbamoyladenosine(37)-C(2))-methylthiotransferase MtaB [Chitinophagales bacterium]|nr:tRNA (N(6)-L-threonylcarbamoyladenosine(37)-C(2))-methylthiotransferase MtaB [Chitinophagales bacterium]MDW8428376.1 tRNA (N(6)-L-threonylcarbamoyladenosine(37)-C(2))-methylthiotransferase MtaB [Chitinophagales bacterium]
MHQGARVAFHTLGCKLNYSETATLARHLQQKGMTVVPFEDAADIYVLNTCSVTDNAEKECRQWVRRLRRRQPQARIVVTGCYAQLQPQQIAAMGVDLVLGMAEKFQLADYLSTLSEGPTSPVVSCGRSDRLTEFHHSFSLGERTRSFLKIQDGCNYHCSFCTIPLARGESRSPTIAEVVQQALALQQAGAQEVVLTGVNVGDFGIINGKRKAHLLNLLEALEQQTQIPRFRISSVEPNLLTDELIDFLAGSCRFMPHLHLPLQSGSDRILASMRRRYKAAFYADRVEKLKSSIPHCCIGADVITGFPGETDEDFEQTYTLLRDLPVDYLHVFTYSERPNTEALRYGEVIPIPVRKQRTHVLRSLSDRKRRLFYAAQLGKVRPVLFEHGCTENGLPAGYTDNYVYVSAAEGRAGSVLPVLLERLNDSVVHGTVLHDFTESRISAIDPLLASH